MKKSNILYILNSSSKHAGSNKSLLNIILNLDMSKFAPIVVLPSRGPICEIFESHNIPIFFVRYFQDIYPYKKGLLRTLLFPLNILRYRMINNLGKVELMKILSQREIDIIHTNVGTIHIGYFASLKLNIKHVWHLREYQNLDFNFLPYPSLAIFKKLLYNNDFNIAISNDIFKHFDLNSNNSCVVYNGIKSKNELVFNSTKQNYFLYAGRLEPNKGIMNLLEAFKKFVNIRDSSIKLLIAGDTNDLIFKSKLQFFVRDNNLSDRVVFLSMRDDIDVLMREARALIVPSLSEGFGRITVEALFNGCLVIGYDNAGTSEILRDKNYGFLYKTSDELIDILSKFDENTINYEGLIATAQKDLAKYSNEVAVSCIMDIYLKVLSSKSKFDNGK